MTNVYLVRFQPTNGFNPRNATNYLKDVHSHAPRWGSDKHGIGVAGFFRTKKEGEKLVGSQLTTEPDKLRTYIDNNPHLEFISVEPVTAQSFVDYEQSVQEALVGSGTEGNSNEIFAASSEVPKALGGGRYQIGGVGMEIDETNPQEPIIIKSVLPAGPAARAGLKSGFLILTIDDTSTVGASLSECTSLIRGKPGTKIRFEVIDPDLRRTNDIVVTREKLSFQKP